MSYRSKSGRGLDGDSSMQTASQLRDEIAQRDSMLNESRKLFTDMKQRYEGLLQAMSGQNVESVSSHSSLPGEISDFAVDKSSELELQQWDLVWTHLVSMITQVIDYPNVRAESGDQKRNVLMALVGKLCEEVSQPRQNEELAKMKRKYAKCKQSLKKLKAQGEQLLQDVARNKQILEGHIQGTKSKEQDALSTQIRQLEDLLKQQIERQTEFLHPKAHSKPTRESPVRQLPRVIPKIDDPDDIPTSDASYSEPAPTRPKSKPAREPSSDDEGPTRSYTVDDKLRAAAAAKAKEKIKLREAEEEAEEILRRTTRRQHQSQPPEPPKETKKHKCSLKKRYGTHVNQLVDLTNQLCSDYRRLGAFDSESLSELSIDRLSRLNESLTSEEQHLSSVSD